MGLPLVAGAQEQTIKINPSGVDLYKLAVVGGEAAKIVATDLDLTGYFKILDPRGFPSALANEPASTINTTNWLQVGAQGVVKVNGAGADIDCRAFEMAKGERPVLDKHMRAADVRQAAHSCANEIVRSLTGEDGFFNTEIAFGGGGRGKVREIMSMDFDGANVRTLTKTGSICMLPSWAPGGRELSFVSYLFGAPDLWAVPASGGRARRMTKGGDALSSGAWSPDGNKIAVTLSHNGNSDIYLMTPQGEVIKRLTEHPAIDTSPAWSPDGSQIAFVSSRLGNPQIYVMNADGSGVKRLTYQGNYNTTPRWCPRKDMAQIAFTARDEHLHFDIFSVDAKTGQVTRFTQNQGDNEEPTWSPNCRVVAYRSSRGGIWVLNPNTRVEHQVYKGAAEAPRWGPPHR
jgi:TolB protein